MADHIVTRAHDILVCRAPARDQTPDPFHGLSPYHRAQLLTMRPTWSERWRLCNPELTKDEKRDLLLDILFERRRAFDQHMKAREDLARRQRLDHHYKTGQAMPLPSHALASSALSDLRRKRLADEEREMQIREDYFRRRAEREADDEEGVRRKRGRGR